MNLTIEKVGNVAVIDVPNEAIDVSNCADFRRDTEAAVADVDQVVLDLANVNFVDSAGLGAMVAAVKMLSGRGGELRLCNVNGSVRALFELVRMHKLVAMFDSREEAVGSFQ